MRTYIRVRKLPQSVALGQGAAGTTASRASPSGSSDVSNDGDSSRCTLGPQSVSDLAAAERVRPQSMAQTVGDLEADGLVERRPDPTDGRRALVSFTEKGRDALDADRRHRVGWLAQAIAEDLSPEEQALLDEATRLLRRLAESSRAGS
jgi:DNA-binding MarR family transcriptional regulator